MFDAMYDVVHVDEKLFYVTEARKRFYLLPDEDIPYRPLKHKSHITKVMFLAAVARPRWDWATNTQFGGLLGIRPFDEQRQLNAQAATVQQARWKRITCPSPRSRTGLC
jgi:hypothetical protein